MLAPDERVVLLDQLRPPQGFDLDYAVATTFTLGMTAALVPPLAFASAALRSSNDPIAALEAVRSCADRVDVFCQAGMIAIPVQHNALFAFLEPMIHPVVAPPGGVFHPKIWLLRYSAAGQDSRYRLLCLSRNLTDDHSWDVALRLDAVRGTEPTKTNEPLSSLIASLTRRLTRRVDPARRRRLKQLAVEAEYLVWEQPEAVTRIAFHTFGVPGAEPTADFGGYRQLIVSPFLDDSGVAETSPSPRDTVIVSRVEALDGLSEDTLAQRGETFVVSPSAGLSAEADTGAGAPPLFGGLHAKMYVVERNRSAHVFLGSANATSAALHRNVEFLVELVGGASKLGIDTLMGTAAEFRTLLEPYEPSARPVDPLDQIRRLIARHLRSLASLDWNIHVEGSHSGDGHILRVSTARPIADVAGLSANLELPTQPGRSRRLMAGSRVAEGFDAVPLIGVTPFLTVRVTHTSGETGATVVRAELHGDPPGRLDEILASQIDTPEKFLRFLALLLGLGSGAEVNNQLALSNGAGHYRRAAAGPGLFESVVRALAQLPRAINDLDRLVRRLVSTEKGRGMLPLGFPELWSLVMQTQVLLAGEGS